MLVSMIFPQLELTIILFVLQISNGIFPAALSGLLQAPSLTVSGGLIYQFFGYPSFAKQFGHWDAASKSYQVSGPW